mgnify:CR=1 FL=1
MSTLAAFTSNGTLPAACTASVWNNTPRSRAILPISAIGCRTPTSLFAAMMLIRIVRSVMAARSRSRSTRPSRFTGRYVTSKPSFSRCLHVSMTALCSVTTVIRWFPFSRYMWAAPLIARLSDSVAPLVNTISFAVAPINSAHCLCATSTASSPSPP